MLIKKNMMKVRIQIKTAFENNMQFRKQKYLIRNKTSNFDKNIESRNENYENWQKHEIY